MTLEQLINLARTRQQPLTRGRRQLRRCLSLPSQERWASNLLVQS